MKKYCLFAAVLSLILLFGLSFAAGAQETVYSGECGENIMWSFDAETGVLQFDGTGEMPDFAGDNLLPWEPFRYDIKSIIFSEGIESVGGSSFGCFLPELTSVYLSDTIENIGSCAFRDCLSLTDINLSGVKYIDCEAFLGCNSLTDIDLSNVEEIGSSAFQYCDNLTSVLLSETIENIGSYSFYGCLSLTDINLSGVKYIDCEAFFGCNSLTDIDLSNVEEIGSYAFCSCTSLTDINLSGVKYIDYGAFFNCGSLTDIDLSNVEEWSYVFDVYNEYIQAGRCGGGTETSIDPQTGEATEINKYCSYVFLKKTGTMYIFGSGEMNREYIDFSWFEGLKSVIFKGSVSSIGYGAFENCEELTSVTLTDSIENIGYDAFFGCLSLSEIDLSNVKQIGNGAFAYCTSLKEVTLGNVNKLGRSVFYNCAALESVIVCGNIYNPKYSSGDVGCNNIFRGCDNLVKITFTGDCTTVPDHFCRNVKSLLAIDIGEKVERISQYSICQNDNLVRLVVKSDTCKINTVVFINTGKSYYIYCNEGSEASNCALAKKRIRPLDYQNENAPVFGDKISCASFVREQMTGSNQDINFMINGEKINFFKIKDISDYIKGLGTEGSLMADVLSYSGSSPVEGDYLRWRIPAYLELDDEAVYYSFLMMYMTDDKQEAALTEKVNGLLPELIRDESTEFEKADAIFDYLKENVTYKDSETDDGLTIPNTAYSALVKGEANCQGSSLAFYRLAREAGLDARIVVNNDIDHMWNIVSVDGIWYYLDLSSALTDTDDREDSYFLKSVISVDGIALAPSFGNDETPVEIQTYTIAENDYCTHDFVLENTVAPTCVDNGYALYVCTLCGDTEKLDRTTATQIHTDENGDNICDICSVTICEHIVYVENAREASCSGDGYTGDEICEKCGNIIKKGSVIPALSHSDEDGNGICDVCGRCMHLSELAEAIKEPTCTELGYKYYVCPDCGETVFYGAELPLADHTDADEDGICDNCGESVNLIRNVFYRFRLALKTITNILKKILKFFTSL